MTFDFDYVILDAYLAINFRNTRLIIDTAPDQWGSHWGTGAAITFNIPKINMTLRPETGFSFYNDSNYTMAWYVGGRMDFGFSDSFVLGAWSSFAAGSADKRWHDKDYANTGYYHADYTGGYIFDIRPDDDNKKKSSSESATPSNTDAIKNDNRNKLSDEPSQPSAYKLPPKQVKRIIVFYTDGTYEER
jgi:hypothetical protein